MGTAGYVNSLWEKKRVVTEVYKSSVLTEMSEFGVPNKGLEKSVALVQYEPYWCGGLGMLDKVEFGHVSCKHTAVFPTYFLSYKRLTPPQGGAEAGSAVQVHGDSDVGKTYGACATPSPKCTDGQIREWVERQHLLGGSQKWVQRGGRKTFNTSDDTFTITPSLNEDATLVKHHAMSFTDARARAAEEEPWRRRNIGASASLQGPPSLSVAFPTILQVPPLLGALGLLMVTIGISVGVTISTGGDCCKSRRTADNSDSEEDTDVLAAKSPMAREIWLARNLTESACRSSVGP